MNKPSRSSWTGLLLLGSFCFGTNAMSCPEVTKQAAFKALTSFAADQNLVIKIGDYEEVVNEISREVCSRFDARAGGLSAKDASDKVTRTYFEQVVAHGRATRVSSIVADVLSDTKGLGRPDRRESGVLNVACPPDVADGVVRIDGQTVGGCAKRILLSAGLRDVAVHSNDKLICRSKISVPAKHEMACKCSTGASTEVHCS